MPMTETEKGKLGKHLSERNNCPNEIIDRCPRGRNPEKCQLDSVRALRECWCLALKD